MSLNPSSSPSYRFEQQDENSEMEIENIIFLIYRKELYLFIFPCNVSDRCLFGLL